MKQRSFIVALSMFLLVFSAILGFISAVITGYGLLIFGSLIFIGFDVFLFLLILGLYNKKLWTSNVLSFLGIELTVRSITKKKK